MAKDNAPDLSGHLFASDGESLNDLAGPERAAADHGDGWLVPPPGGIPDTMPTEGANGSKAWRAHTL